MSNIEKLTGRIAQLEDILDSINDGFFTVDVDFNFTYTNRAFERMCGCQQGEMLGKNYWVQFPKAKYAKFWQQYNKAFKEQEVLRFEEYSTTLNKWVSVSVYPTIDNLSVYFTDVTEAHNYRITIQAQNNSLMEIAHMLSHEVRAPVASILGLAPIVNTDQSITKNEEILSAIINKCNELDDVIKEMNRRIQDVLTKEQD